MNPALSTPATPEQLELLVQMAHARYIVALLLLWGLLTVTVATFFLAVGWRKIGFLCLAIYGGLMSFLGVGLCYLFGPAIAIFSCGGFVLEWIRPASRRARSYQENGYKRVAVPPSQK